MDFGVCLHHASALELRWPRVRIADPGSQPTPEDSEGEHYRQHRIAKEVAYKISHARGITKASRTAGNRGAEPCTRRVMPRTCRGGQRQVLSPFGRREPGQRVQLPQHKPHPSRHPGAAANEPLMLHQPRLVLLLPPLPSISRWSQLSKFLVWTRSRSGTSIMRPRASRTTDGSEGDRRVLPSLPSWSPPHCPDSRSL
jgi:hypothetical protein